MTDQPVREPARPDPLLDRTDMVPTPEAERHPDSPGGASVDDELTDATKESMETLGRAELDEEMDPAASEQHDESPPGQNSDWLPE